jgi:hypothetical protein
MDYLITKFINTLFWLSAQNCVGGLGGAFAINYNTHHFLRLLKSLEKH